MEVKMATKNPRLNVVLEPSVYAALLNLAQKEGVSLSLKARDLIRQALEYCENVYWAKEADKREKTFDRKKALSHKEVWDS
jgi:transcriptional antiterminator Rof (Rho-off)